VLDFQGVVAVELLLLIVVAVAFGMGLGEEGREKLLRRFGGGYAGGVLEQGLRWLLVLAVHGLVEQ